MIDNIKPSWDKVIVQPIQEKNDDNLFLPNNIQDYPTKGLVVAVGDGVNGIKPQCEVGDIIIFKKGHGIPIEIDGSKFIILRDNPDSYDILGIYKKNNLSQ